MVRNMYIVMCLISLNGIAQQEVYVRSGLLRSSLTFSPSLMLNNTTTNYYLSGFVEGYLGDNLSLRGESHYLLGADNAELSPYFKNSIRTSFGIQYHQNIKNFDSYIGFLPSISFSQLNEEFESTGRNTNHFEPSFALKAGITYYVYKYFNFFIEMTYYNTTIRILDRINGRADELMFSAGLGFNINAKKK